MITTMSEVAVVVAIIGDLSRDGADNTSDAAEQTTLHTHNVPFNVNQPIYTMLYQLSFLPIQPRFNRTYFHKSSSREGGCLQKLLKLHYQK